MSSASCTRKGSRPREATLKSHGGDHRRPDRHRPGADGGVPAHGLLRRLDRRDLPPVLRHHRLGHGAVDHGGPGADAGAVRHPAQAGRKASRPASSTGASSRWFNRNFDAFRELVSQRSLHWCPAPRLGDHDRLCRRSSRCMVGAVRPPAHRLPARRGPGLHLQPDHPAAGRHPAAHPDGGRSRWRTITSTTKRTMSTSSSPWPASPSPAPARIPAWPSSS